MSRKGLKEVRTRPVDPGAILGGPITGRDLIIISERPEVVDPEEIIEFSGAPDPAYPPVVSSIPERRPVIDRVSPELPGLTEDIRRHPCHHSGAEVLIEFEDLRVLPDIDAIIGDVYRYISDDLDAEIGAVPAEG